MNDKQPVKAGNEADVLTVSVTLERADLVREMFWYARRRKSLWLFFSFAIAASLLVMGYDRDFGLLLSICCCIGLAAGALGIYFQSSRAFSGLRDFQKQFSYTFSDTGYDTTNAEANSSGSWNNILRAIESQHSFNLFIHKNFFLLVPKRCFASPTDIQRFRDLLRRNLGGKAVLRAQSHD